MANIGHTKWAVENNHVLLVMADGTRSHPTALDIYRSAHAGATEICGLANVPSAAKELPWLQFSQFPVAPVIRVSGFAPAPARIHLGIDLNDQYSELESGCDAIVVGNVWHPVDNEALEETIDWLKSLGLEPGSDASLGQLMRMRLASDAPARLIDGYVLEGSPDFTDRARSAGLVAASLYPYQERGIAFLRHVASQDVGCLLADEMGLGKTLQVIALLAAETNRGLKPNLVVCPATLVENWRRELARFAPTLRVLIHAGHGRPGTAHTLRDADVVITTYDVAIRDQVILESIQWNVVAADEAQAIKNPDTQRTSALKEIPRRVSIAVTGTPVENSLQDLWSICDFVLPGFLGSRTEFLDRFDDSHADAVRLGERVSPLILHRRVAEVATDLPDRLEIPQAISVGSEFCAAYERVRQEALTEYDAGAGIVAMTRLRMLCAHPSLVGDSFAAIDTPKLDRLFEILEEVFSASQKAIIFTTYQKMTDLLLFELSRRWNQGAFDFIDGRVAVDERQEIVDRFTDFGGCGALILNPKAAGTGLNITAANHVIHYNPEWNPAVTDQASARSYRRRQTLPVTIHHLFLADTIEDAIMERSGFKRELSEGAVRGNEGLSESQLIKRALEISPVTAF